VFKIEIEIAFAFSRYFCFSRLFCDRSALFNDNSDKECAIILYGYIESPSDKNN